MATRDKKGRRVTAAEIFDMDSVSPAPRRAAKDTKKDVSFSPVDPEVEKRRKAFKDSKKGTLSGTLSKSFSRLADALLDDGEQASVYSTVFAHQEMDRVVFFTPDTPGGKLSVMSQDGHGRLDESSSDESDEEIGGPSGKWGWQKEFSTTKAASGPVPERPPRSFTAPPNAIPSPAPGREGLEEPAIPARSVSTVATVDTGELPPWAATDEPIDHEKPKHHKRRKKKKKKPQKPKKAIFIWLVTAVNVLLLAWCIFENGGVEPMTLNPLLGPKMEILIKYGAKYGPAILEQGEWWRFGTAMFLHVGIIHLVFNMSFQIGTGRFLEMAYGPRRMAIIYILSGIGGNLLSAIMIPDQISVGASSSLYGLLGVMLTDLIQNWKRIMKPWVALIKMIIQIILSLAIGLLPGIDNFAHVGGLVTGLIAGVVWLPNVSMGKWSLRFKRLIELLALLGLAMIFILGFLMFYLAVSSLTWCKWCEEINCLSILGFCELGTGSNPIPQ